MIINAFPPLPFVSLLSIKSLNLTVLLEDIYHSVSDFKQNIGEFEKNIRDFEQNVLNFEKNLRNFKQTIHEFDKHVRHFEQVCDLERNLCGDFKLSNKMFAI